MQVSETMRKSQASANSKPTPKQYPRLAAMTGFRQRAGAAMFQARRETCSGEASRKPEISPPLEKCSPVARSTTTRTRASASSASNTARNCSRSVIVTMLSGGRSRITSARCCSGSSSRRKPSKLSGSVGSSGGGSLMLFPSILARDEQAAQDLADRRFRDFGDKHVLAWALVIGEARTPAPGVERVGLDRAAALYEGGDPLPPALVRQARDRRLGDRRMQ